MRRLSRGRQATRLERVVNEDELTDDIADQLSDWITTSVQCWEAATAVVALLKRKGLIPDGE